MARGFVRVWIVLLICSTVCLLPATGSAQATANENDPSLSPNSQTQTAETKYRSVITRLSGVESEILELRNSKAQRDFDKVESTLFALQEKRETLDELERKWKLLGNGKPALEIEPRLNFSEQKKRKLLVELEGSKEKVLRHKAELLKLNAEYGPGHPSIIAANKKLAELESVADEQNSALEDLGVEVKSSVAKHKLKTAMLKRVELKTKFGPGHPSVAAIESEIEMLESEMLASPNTLAGSEGPSIELVTANLELSEAGTKYGAGHPVCVALKKKIEVLEELAESESESEALINKDELAKRLAARIEVLQDRILSEEEKLDSINVKKDEFEKLEQKTQALMKHRAELSSEMQRLSLEVQPKVELDDQERIRVKQQLLSGIDALEFLGKTDEAKQLREILGGLEKSDSW